MKSRNSFDGWEGIVAIMAMLFVVAVTAFAGNPVIAKAHKTTHHLKITDLMGGDEYSCSGTAIFAHAILTAAHCIKPGLNIVIDGDSYTIAAVLEDSLDHAIILLDGDPFTDLAVLKQDADIDIGDSVFLFGNPGELSDMYRKGVLSGYESMGGAEDTGSPLGELFKQFHGSSVKAALYDLNGYFGDSGSALFNEKGDVVAVVSTAQSQSASGVTAKYMGSLPMRFTDAALSFAKKYAPPKEKVHGEFEQGDPHQEIQPTDPIFENVPPDTIITFGKEIHVDDPNTHTDHKH